MQNLQHRVGGRVLLDSMRAWLGGWVGSKEAIIWVWYLVLCGGRTCSAKVMGDLENETDHDTVNEALPDLRGCSMAGLLLQQPCPPVSCIHVAKCALGRVGACALTSKCLPQATRPAALMMWLACFLLSRDSSWACATTPQWACPTPCCASATTAAWQTPSRQY